MVLYKGEGGAEVTCIGSGVQMRLQSGGKESHAPAPPSSWAHSGSACLGWTRELTITVTGTGQAQFVVAITLYVFQDPYVLLAVGCRRLEQNADVAMEMSTPKATILYLELDAQVFHAKQS